MTVQDIEKNRCCGCSYCISICPVGAISMKYDEDGNLFPSVSNSCINCGKCVSECVISSKHTLTMPIETYAGCRKNHNKLVLSSSGGIFAAVAERVVSKGWYVCGCVLTKQLEAKHILTNNKNMIRRMYGSKYVQSNSLGIYSSVLEVLKQGNKVLFSGTPCQVAAVKQFCKNHQNLYTIEVICHGVSSPQMFQSYLDKIGGSKIDIFVFRDKEQGWSFNNKAIYKNGKKRKINHRLSSYMTYYLNGETYRDVCYECPFACEFRGADLTIGDFWGVVKEKQNRWEGLDAEKGVSCILVNSEKGKELCNTEDMVKYPVPYESIKKGNEPLNHPSKHSSLRSIIMKEWNKKHDWKDVDVYFNDHDCKLVYKIWSLIPIKLQHFVRVILGKR